MLRQSLKLLTLENALHGKFARWKLLIAFYPPLQTATPKPWAPLLQLNTIMVRYSYLFADPNKHSVLTSFINDVQSDVQTKAFGVAFRQKSHKALDMFRSPLSAPLTQIYFSPLCLFMCLRKALGSEHAKSHCLHFSDFSPLCVFKCVLKSLAWEHA